AIIITSRKNRGHSHTLVPAALVFSLLHQKLNLKFINIDNNYFRSRYNSSNVKDTMKSIFLHDFFS
ncbi:unnamed protein product, partial [Amoebophrya sp. A25]